MFSQKIFNRIIRKIKSQNYQIKLEQIDFFRKHALGLTWSNAESDAFDKYYFNDSSKYLKYRLEKFVELINTHGKEIIYDYQGVK